MTSRVWPLPNLRNGTTINLITDSHAGARFFTPDRHARMGDDLDDLRAATHGHVHAGDSIHWVTDDGTGELPEDAEFLALVNGRKAKSGKPWVLVPGNHDYSSFTGPNYPKRDAAAWASAVGVPSHLSVTDIGDVRVLGIGPDRWDYDVAKDTYGTCLIPPATLTWLDRQLTAAGSRPVFIACHSPLWEQYAKDAVAGDFVNGSDWFVSPKDNLTAIIDGHPNVAGWISGHVHADIDVRPSHARSMTVGSRRIFAVNGPASGGRMEGLVFADQQLKSPIQSMFITYMGDAIDVRWRDHLSRQWDYAGTDRVRHILLAS